MPGRRARAADDLARLDERRQAPAGASPLDRHQQSECAGVAQRAQVLVGEAATAIQLGCPRRDPRPSADLAHAGQHASHILDRTFGHLSLLPPADRKLRRYRNTRTRVSVCGSCSILDRALAAGPGECPRDRSRRENTSFPAAASHAETRRRAAAPACGSGRRGRASASNMNPPGVLQHPWRPLPWPAGGAKVRA